VASPELTRVLILVTRIGSPSVLGMLGAVLTAVFLWRRWWRGFILLPVAMLGAHVLSAELKMAFHRPRPEALYGYHLPHSYSFPSGHALFAFCFFAAAVALVVPRVQSVAFRWLIGLVGAAAVLSIGFSRIYLGVHFASDVIASYAIGTLWMSLIAVGDRVAHAWARRRGGA